MMQAGAVVVEVAHHLGGLIRTDFGDCDVSCKLLNARPLDGPR